MLEELFRQRSASECVIKQVIVNHDLENMSIRSKPPQFLLYRVDLHGYSPKKFHSQPKSLF